MIRLLGDECAGDVSVLRFSGEIDDFSVSGLRSVLRSKAHAKCPVLLLDFSGVTFVNSRAMAALIEYWRESRRFGGAFAIVGLSEKLRETFHIVRLDESLRLFSTVENALDVLGRPAETSAAETVSL